jgi:TrmH family RNA methyltransferase
MEVNIYKTTSRGVVVMGNGRMAKELEALIKNKLSIPRFGKSKKTFKCGRSNRNCTE